MSETRDNGRIIRTWQIVWIFALLFALSLLLDIPIANWVSTSGTGKFFKSSQARLLVHAVRFFGNFAEFTLVAVVMLLCMGKLYWRAAMYVFVSGVSAASASFVKWIVGRRRPILDHHAFSFHPFNGGVHGLFGPGLSFPSGDACLAAATATAIALLWPRLRWGCMVVVGLVAAERVAEMAHYPSDTVAGAALGWAGARLSYRMMFPTKSQAFPEQETGLS